MNIVKHGRTPYLICAFLQVPFPNLMRLTLISSIDLMANVLDWLVGSICTPIFCDLNPI